jgi:hypothetical protein
VSRSRPSATAAAATITGNVNTSSDNNPASIRDSAAK